jgi:CubicO group peptidase (beta-lactamase class C family)
MPNSRSLFLSIPFCAAIAVILGVSPQSSVAQAAAGQQAPVAKPSAQLPPAQTPQAAAPETHDLTPDDVSAFLDGYMPSQLLQQDIAGAVVIIVKDGKVFFSRGYGYSDVATKKPVSVDDTLFRPGSVSKLFTCTAVMQLVEQGKLDLDRDVNDYLDFKIPATYPDPVTLRRIMTHTAGFEEWDKALFVAHAGELQPEGEAMREYLPARIFAPGTMPAYSNYAMSLAGYMVQRISGEKFEDYIANHILKPLGMNHATFAQPLPADLASLMSSGYQLASQPKKDFEFVNGVPAGAMSVSAGDIAHFMIAHLGDGSYVPQHETPFRAQILKPETLKLMHSRAFGPVPELNGMDLAFFQENENGHSIIGHGGDTQYFHSHLHLILDANLGLFISVNSAGRGQDIRGLLWRKFLDRYFPAPPPLQPAASTAAQDAQTVVGTYITSRRGETTITKLLALLGETTFVVDSDNTISSPQLLGVNGAPRHWREIGPMLFRDVDSQGKLSFQRSSSGQLEIFSDAAAFGEQRVGALESRNFCIFLLVLAIGLPLLTIVLWPVSALVRRHYHYPLALGSGECTLRTWTRIVCLLDLAIILGWFIFFSYIFSDIGRATSRVDWALYVLHIAQIFAIVGTILPIIYAISGWFSPDRWGWGKVFDTLTAIGCLCFLWLLWLGNFIHFSTKY